MADNRFSRRGALRRIAQGCGGLAATRWLFGLARAVADAGENSDIRPRSVILLWLNGGPSTIDLWDLKTQHANGGSFAEIETAVPGMRISEHLPRLATLASNFSLVRSMSTREGDHARARFASVTGYTPQGAIQFPALGSLVAHEFHHAGDIPNYVHIGGQPSVTGGGFLGPQFAPFVVGGRGRRGDAAMSMATPKVDDLTPFDESRQGRRLQLQGDLDKLASLPSAPVIDSLNSARERALRLMNPQAARAFNLDEEDSSLRESYGQGAFGQGCLMARRLVERGVSFVDVTLDGWDTHANNFERVRELSQQLDRGAASLLNDLRERGLLESTLVVCQGEFGRTPRINGQAGRDHWPATWALMLAGAGIRGGRVVGRTSTDGTQLESDPVHTADLMATILRGIGLDPRKQNMSNVGRPIRLADPDGKAIEELL